MGDGQGKLGAGKGRSQKKTEGREKQKADILRCKSQKAKTKEISEKYRKPGEK